MSLQEHKLTDYAVSIAGLPDKIENKAQWLKQQFDARTDSEVRDRHNSLIDALDEDLAGRPTNESMAGAIDEKVVELGAGDMAQKIYDPEKKKQDIFAYADAVRNYAQQVKEDSEQRDKGLKDYVDRISAGGESIKCGPAETVTFTAGANRLESVAVSGFTTQTGTGDPAPDNVRPIQNAGMRNKLMTVTGNTDGLFMSSVVPTRVAVLVPDAIANQELICDLYESNRVSQTDKTCYMDSNKNFGITDSRFTSLEEAKRILNEEPVTFAYQSTQDSGEYYTGVAVQQNGAYRCEIIRLADRLHAGDTMETNVQSEYDAYAEFDGSSDENWLLDSGSTAWADGSKRMWIKLTGPQTENTSDKAVPVAASNQLTAQSAETTYIAKAANCFDVVYSGATNMLHVRIAGISTVEALKTHLQSHPLRVFYKSTSGGAPKNIKREEHAKKTYVLTGTESNLVYSEKYKTLAVKLDNIAGDKTQEQVPGVVKCSHFKTNVPVNGIQAQPKYRQITIMGATVFDSLESAKAYLAEQYAAGTPVTIEYDLASPEVYADAPVQLENTKGSSTVSSEKSTTLTVYIRSTKELQPLTVSLNGASQGQYNGETKQDINLVVTPQSIGALPKIKYARYKFPDKQVPAQNGTSFEVTQAAMGIPDNGRVVSILVESTGWTGLVPQHWSLSLGAKTVYVLLYNATQAAHTVGPIILVFYYEE